MSPTSIDYKKVKFTAIALAVLTGISLFINKETTHYVSNLLANNHILSSIVYGFLFIVGFNLLILLIGYAIKRGENSDNEMVSTSKRRARLYRKRKLENRHVSAFYGIK